MANPQKENGHIDIAHEIAEALARTNLNGYESRYLWVLWRKTYGWHKKEDTITNSQFSDATGINRPHIWRTEQGLIERQIVTKLGNKLSFQKDYTRWRELPKLVTVTNLGTRVTKSGNKELPKMVHTKETTKETIQKKDSDVPSLEVFTLKEAIKKMEDSPRRDINIIALFLERKKPDIRSSEQLSTAIKRHLRAAKLLSPFTNNQILEAIPKAERLTIEWTLETLTKVLTK